MRKSVQPKLLSIRDEREVLSLRDLSARVGSDPLLVQASNGNTSIKLDGILWIKASGKWLAHATQEGMFLPLELAEVKESIQKNTEIVPRFAQKHGLRPSIETPMHAILRHRVVIHVHSINALAWAIRLDGPDQLRAHLTGLHWQWIPYATSGIPLAREIEKAVASAPETDVLMLGNHGLVVCGQDCQGAEKLLREVEQRLAMAIFLGSAMPLFPPAVVLSKFTERLCGTDRTPPFVAVERSGVMLNERMSSSERATLIGLVQVTQRTEESARLRYLNEVEVTDVVSKGAHGRKEVIVQMANSPADVKKLDEQRAPSAGHFFAGAGSC